MTRRWRDACGSLGRQCSSSLLVMMMSTPVACGGESQGASPQVEPARVRVAISEHIATVATVTWETDAKSVGYVEYGTSAELGTQVAVRSKVSQIVAWISAGSYCGSAPL